MFTWINIDTRRGRRILPNQVFEEENPLPMFDHAMGHPVEERSYHSLRPRQQINQVYNTLHETTLSRRSAPPSKQFIHHWRNGPYPNCNHQSGYNVQYNQAGN